MKMLMMMMELILLVMTCEFVAVIGWMITTRQQQQQRQSRAVSFPRQQRQPDALSSVFSNQLPFFRRRHHQQQQQQEQYSLSAAESTVEDKNNIDDLQFSDLRILLIDHYDSFTYNLVDLVAQLCSQSSSSNSNYDEDHAGRDCVTVIPADAATSWQELLSSNQVLPQSLSSYFDGILFSPGPGSPYDPESELARNILLDQIQINQQQQQQGNFPTAADTAVPILGVCLGHQILGAVYNYTVTKSPTPVHGQVCLLEQKQHQQHQQPQSKNHQQEYPQSSDPLWKGIPNRIWVTRYHSLCVRLENDDDDDDDNNIKKRMNHNHHQSRLIGSAWSVCDGATATETEPVCMALRHSIYPHYGVQFHPESIGSLKEQQQQVHKDGIGSKKIEQHEQQQHQQGQYGYGKQLLHNFLSICLQHKQQRLELSQQQQQQVVKQQKEQQQSVHPELIQQQSFINEQQQQQQQTFNQQQGQQQQSQNSRYKVYITKISRQQQQQQQQQQSPRKAYEEEKEEDDAMLIPVVQPETILQDWGWKEEPYVYWLDSSSSSNFNNSNNNMARFSILGVAQTRRIEYWGKTTNKNNNNKKQQKGVFVYHNHTNTNSEQDTNNKSSNSENKMTPTTTTTTVQHFDMDILTYMQKEAGTTTTKSGGGGGGADEDSLESGGAAPFAFNFVTFDSEEEKWHDYSYNCQNNNDSNHNNHIDSSYKMEQWTEGGSSSRETLPFSFRGGWVGYLGYEVRFDTERMLHRQQQPFGRTMQQQNQNKQEEEEEDSLLSLSLPTNGIESNKKDDEIDDDDDDFNEKVPTAAFVFADRSLVFDHQEQEWYMVAVTDENRSSSSSSDFENNNNFETERAIQWMKDTRKRILLSSQQPQQQPQQEEQPRNDPERFDTSALSPSTATTTNGEKEQMFTGGETTATHEPFTISQNGVNGFHHNGNHEEKDDDDVTRRRETSTRVSTNGASHFPLMDDSTTTAAEDNEIGTESEKNNDDTQNVGRWKQNDINGKSLNGYTLNGNGGIDRQNTANTIIRTRVVDGVPSVVRGDDIAAAATTSRIRSIAAPQLQRKNGDAINGGGAKSFVSNGSINGFRGGGEIESKRLDSNTLSGLFQPKRSKETYNKNFADCLRYIRQGESYELCLTNQLEAKIPSPAAQMYGKSDWDNSEESSTSSITPFDLYQILRKRNPAPFSAYFNWNSQKKQGPKSEPESTNSKASVAICCSSPERFVSVKPIIIDGQGDQDVDGEKVLKTQLNALQVEAKPIKGTRARVRPQNSSAWTQNERDEDFKRARDLQNSLKDRAENLMIVDLLRNDISRVCRAGSVHVAKLMDIETYATVHQMVSTIRGTLDLSTSSAVDVLKACFPGGSMTGAPKLRTMELLHGLEEGAPRGPYSGCLGYISLNGCMDMNIVIRTAVVTSAEKESGAEWNVKVGAGGAITILSDNDDEYEELILKASAVVGAVEEWAAANDESGKGSFTTSDQSQYDNRSDNNKWQETNQILDSVMEANDTSAARV